MLTTFAAAGDFDVAAITALFLSLAVLLGLARLLGEISAQLKQPAILGEILAGILLGPTVLGAIWPEGFNYLFPTTGPVGTTLQGLFIISAVLLLLMAGLEVELSTVWREGKSALSVALASIVAPFIVGFGLAWLWPGLLGLAPGGELLPFALFIGIALSITALPVIAKILIDLHLAKSDFGVIVISAAMLNDLVGWMGFAVVLAMIAPGAEGNGGGSGVGTTILLTFIFIGLMLTAGKYLFHHTLPRIQANWSWPGGVLGFVLVISLLGAAFTEWIGIHSIFGAFIAGVAIGDSRHLRQRTRDTIHQFTNSFFAPLFFASIGLGVNFLEAFDFVLTVIVLAVAIVGKLMGGYIGSWWAGHPNRQRWAIGFAMSARGAMEIILAQLAITAGLITEELFVAIVIMALVTSLMSGPAMQWLLQRPQRRKLGEILAERQFIADLDALNARDAIRVLSQRAAEILDRTPKEIDQAVWAREQIVRTGMGNGLAVPHARLSDLAKPLVIIGRDKDGVDFDAPDGQPARFICLLLTPADDPSAQIELLGMVARAFESNETRVAAREAQSFTEFRAALRLGDQQEQAHG